MSVREFVMFVFVYGRLKNISRFTNNKTWSIVLGMEDELLLNYEPFRNRYE